MQRRPAVLSEEARSDLALSAAHAEQVRREQSLHVERRRRQRALQRSERVEGSLGRRLGSRGRGLGRDGRAGAEKVEDQPEMRRVPIDEVRAVRRGLDAPLRYLRSDPNLEGHEV